ncbi:coiled-coil domain-containing protein 86-like [Balaenoptera ricei]|uniref:coiled-coil domain-containing protein 86-like n=1 Tax=Balaenoptera ricei TaxID=2746895 RepID=UPI0028BD7EF8|nr:coiled-coil domain-containing protein 86-like [Balaenoptera ricei]
MFQRDHCQKELPGPPASRTSLPWYYGSDGNLVRKRLWHFRISASPAEAQGDLLTVSPPPRPAPRHAVRTTATRLQPAPRGGQPCLPYRLNSPRELLTGSTAAVGTRGAHREQETTPPLGLRHLNADLERSSGTAKGPAGRTPAPRDARRRRGPSQTPPRGALLARRAEAAKREWQRTPARPGPEAGVGRLGVGPDAAPLPSDTTDRRGGEARGLGQNEKGGPVRHERPSIVWRGLGPAPASRTSPHPSIDLKDRVISSGTEDKKIKGRRGLQEKPVRSAETEHLKDKGHLLLCLYNPKKCAWHTITTLLVSKNGVLGTVQSGLFNCHSDWGPP